jgi:two-component system, NarL family, nitrate/nitrite response regulator NarL
LLQSREFQVVAVCPDARSAFLMADTLEPDIFVVDPVLPDANGLDVIQTLRICLPTCAVVAFSHPCSNEAVLRAFRNGARAFVLKGDPSESLIHALRAVSVGSCFISEVTLASLRKELMPEVEEDPETKLLAAGNPTLH